MPIIYVVDPLVELPGPEDFDLAVAREELRRSRTGERMSVAVLDIDGLRAVNESAGPAAGTDLLVDCAAALRRSLRAVDQFARTGADEFSALLLATDARRAGAWADRFETALEEASRHRPGGPASCAIGIADTDECPTLIDALARARRRMELVQRVRQLRRDRN